VVPAWSPDRYLYSAGYSPQAIDSLVKTVQWDDIYSNMIKRKNLFVSQKANQLTICWNCVLTTISNLRSLASLWTAFYDLLVPMLADAQMRSKGNFDSLRIPLRIIATDLLTGEKWYSQKKSGYRDSRLLLYSLCFFSC
jgi:predicted acylesterase/phospholipase RssA